MPATAFPDFFDQSPVIVVRDPLADFLGAAADGVLEYRYADAVRLAGHSCPTVASAFLMTRAALAALYGDVLPVRGEIRVDLVESHDAGVAGVIASIATLITGATTDTGFRGLAGQFNRRNKLYFHQPLTHGELRYARLDSGAAVEVAADLSSIPGASHMGELMRMCLTGQASAAQAEEFRTLWQDRVRRLLLEYADDPAVIRLYPT
jgi:hypothetical protein